MNNFAVMSGGETFHAMLPKCRKFYRNYDAARCCIYHFTCHRAAELLLKHLSWTNHKAAATHELAKTGNEWLDFFTLADSTRNCGINLLRQLELVNLSVLRRVPLHHVWTCRLRWLPQANAVTVRCPFGAPWYRRPASNRLINSPGGDTIARCSVSIVTWIGSMSSCEIAVKRIDAVYTVNPTRHCVTL